MAIHSIFALGLTFILKYNILYVIEAYTCQDYTGSCTFWQSVGECYLNPSLQMCDCSISCNTPNLCISQPGGDTHCLCRYWASNGRCESDPTVQAQCPGTCSLRETVSCPPLVMAPNAHVSHSGTRFNDIVKIYCDSGYEKTSCGDGMHACKETGEWVREYTDRDEPTICVSIDPYCGIPPLIIDAFVSFTGQTIHDAATYACDAGTYQASGDIYRQCSDGGIWGGYDIVCLVPYCEEPPDIHNTMVTVSGYVIGDVATYTCKEWMYPNSGDLNKQCSTGQIWVGEDLVCAGFKSQRMVRIPSYTECVSITRTLKVRSRLECLVRCQETTSCIGATYNKLICSLLIPDPGQTGPCATENSYINTNVT